MNYVAYNQQHLLMCWASALFFKISNLCSSKVTSTHLLRNKKELECPGTGKQFLIMGLRLNLALKLLPKGFGKWWAWGGRRIFQRITLQDTEKLRAMILVSDAWAQTLFSPLN